MTSSTDIAWAAGLFEGEGSITLQKDGRRVSLALGMTDEDVVRRFAKIMDVGTVGMLMRDHRGAHYKTMWRWQASAHHDVLAVIFLLGPWFGARRRAKADQAVDRIVWALVHCSRGHDKPSGSKGGKTCNREAA